MIAALATAGCAGGADGSEGPPGPQGPTGATGSAGATGAVGRAALVRSAVEPEGENCPSGGFRFEAGLDADGDGVLSDEEVDATLTRHACNGSQGLEGPQGPPGPTGAQGPQGVQGSQGPSGPQGLTGAQGPQGPTGPQGAEGPAGPTGPQGESVVGMSIGAGDPDCAWGGTRLLVGVSESVVCNGAPGPTGPEGAAGSVGPEGPIGPAGAQGERGPEGPAGTFTGTFVGPVELQGDVSVTGTIHAPNAALVPAGSVLMFASASCPSGWLKANGAVLQRSDYPALFAAIGTLYGSPTTDSFRLPELRGEFVRALDDGRGVDVGRPVGTWQAQDFKSLTLWNDNPGYSWSHGPAYLSKTGRSGNLFGGYWAAPAGAITGQWDGSEVRPRNVALLFCIKH